MDQIVEENQFLNNFLKQFKGKNQKEILDSLLVIGADSIISNFKFSHNLQEDILKASKKIQSYFVQGDQSQLKNEIESLRQELTRLNQKFDGKQEKMVVAATATPVLQQFSPPTKIQFSNQQANKSEQRKQGVKKIPFQEKNQSSLSKLYQENQEASINQTQKRIGRSSSLCEVNTSGSKSKKPIQQVALKVTEVTPNIPKPIKYTPKYHHLNDEQVKSNFENYKQFNIENDQHQSNKQKSNYRQFSQDNNFQHQKYQQKEVQNQFQPVEKQHQHGSQNHFNDMQNKQSNNANEPEVVNNYRKGQNQNSFETLDQNKINPNYYQYQSNKEQNKFNFNVQNQFGIQGQISPKFNDAIANYHTNQLSSRNDQHSFNQNDHNSLHNYNKNNIHDQQQSFEHAQPNSQSDHPQRIKNRSNQSFHGRSNQSFQGINKGSINQSPQHQKTRQKSMSQKGSRKIYYDPRKMRKGDIFNPVNSKKEQLNVQRAQSKIKGEIQERKLNQKQFGKKYEDVEVFVNQPPGYSEQESQLANNNSQLNNSYQNVSSSNNNNYYNQNFQPSSYNLQSQQQNISSSSQIQSQQQQQLYDINEDSAQFEDRPRQINNYSVNSANNTFLNKSRSYTATTAATGDIRQSQNLYSQNFYGAKQQNSFKNNFNDLSDYQNRNSQNPSASKQFHQESTGSFAVNENHNHQLRYTNDQVEVSPQRINQLYDPKVENQSYGKNQIQQQQLQGQRYYDGDESDIIVHDDGQMQNTFIQDSANRQSMSSRFVGNQTNNNNQQQQSQFNQTVNDSINNRSYYNYQNLNQHLTQHYIRSNNQSLNGPHPYLQTSQALGQNQQINERNSHRTENSFQDQSSILQNPFATAASYQPQRIHFNKQRNMNGSFSQMNPSYQNQYDNSGYINSSNNYIQNPFRDNNNNNKTYDQNSYLGIERLSNSQIDNRQSINDEVISSGNYLKGGLKQSQNIYEQRYKELVQKQEKVGNSQQLVFSDQIQHQQQQQQQQTKNLASQYQNKYQNQSYDALKSVNNYADYSQNNLNSSNNYIIPNRLQNLNSTQRSKLTTERSPDQQNSISKKSEQNVSPDLSNRNNRQLADQKTYYQDPTSQSINKQIQGKSQQRAAVPHFQKNELQDSADKYQKEFSRNLEQNNNNNYYKQYKPHETFTNRQENMCEYSITSRDPQSPPLKIQVSGEGSVESEDFSPFEVTEQRKKVFQDDKLFFKESQQYSQSRSQTTRSEQ
ncbi:endo-1,4-beta-xylanase xylA, putative (macronuclear) [Tetrahymena thermophila SB210]|uniref:Endo-1,4-beta-xylanase xylA, putative n=1 Tax=Tetrahymena thermophila (strain SB210) TaxID=312017 RepID=Q24D00_TETTS|nr:endo-1,4-beta-xylanase xylA, putative [Tetrahymena thermophila SB210]EAS05608.2 endo-1,4-beta-xylanase xylA, putative [Tetrahymena thermophila SB210]|eukprot:XP_001025853.2 endo-1,4-beta-xylanase xylA, putative [Tetrahymena thermophila SB210]